MWQIIYWTLDNEKKYIYIYLNWKYDSYIVAVLFIIFMCLHHDKIVNIKHIGGYFHFKPTLP